jgi:CheY-like chemotaxis protein
MKQAAGDVHCARVVLIVEDEEDTRELLRQLLEERGYAVATARDGREAIALLSCTPSVCFVILDLAMPRMDGLAVLVAMANDPKLSAFPVCISTSNTDQAPPGLPCLSKPVDIARLYALVDEHCTG